MQSEFDKSLFGELTERMRDEFRRSCSQFATVQELSLVVGSWNVNAKEEESSRLSTWLNPVDLQESDVVVVGLQEVIELTPTNTVIGSSYSGSSENSSSISSSACEKWLVKLLAHLNQGVSSEAMNFTLLESLSMVGIAIFVFVRPSVRNCVKGVQARSISRGGGGILGNKGAVCVRFEVNDTSYCFSSAHLCAHREDVLKRNEDFRVIYNTPVFQRPNHGAMQRIKSDSHRSSRNAATAAASNKLKAKIKSKEDAKTTEDINLKRVKDHDVVFIFGDLNYRVAEGFEIREVYDVLELSPGSLMSEVNSILLEQDQLSIERKENRAFQGFNEATVNFKPTYQYLAGTDEYDRRPDRKLRCPGWCDRILWKTHNSLFYGYESLGESFDEKCRSIGYIKSTSYSRGENIISDHKPICGTFKMSSIKIDHDAKQKSLLNAATTWCEDVKNSGSLAVSVSPQHISIQNHAADSASMISLIVSNNSPVTAVNCSVSTPVWLVPSTSLSSGGIIEIPPLSNFQCDFDIAHGEAKSVIESTLPGYSTFISDEFMDSKLMSNHSKMTKDEVVELPYFIQFSLKEPLEDIEHIIQVPITCRINCSTQQ